MGADHVEQQPIDAIDQNDHEPINNEIDDILRPRVQVPTLQAFKNAMDAPHDGKSYFPQCKQLLQKALKHTSQMARACTKMSEVAGLKAAEADALID